jgi:2-C-methyl-D-erythritol 2,4-cyclodiphosphate synthase
MIGNIDLTILAERPKLAPHIEAIKNSLSKILKIYPNQIGIKATTNEGLGPVGREEGIATLAVCLLVRIKSD